MPAESAVHVEGLSQALKGLNRFSATAGQEARDLLRDGAKTVQTAAQAKMGRRPGGGTYPRRLGMIGRSASFKGAGITLRGARYPWAWGAEFGARRAWVFGRVTIQGQLRRRQFPIWRGNQFVVRGSGGPGWIIQPAIRENLDRVLTTISSGLEDVVARHVKGV